MNLQLQVSLSLWSSGFGFILNLKKYIRDGLANDFMAIFLTFLESGLLKGKFNKNSSSIIQSRPEYSGVVRSGRESSEVVRSRPELIGAILSRLETSGVVPSWTHPESSWVIQSFPESSEV